jgi:hypothetical protein
MLERGVLFFSFPLHNHVGAWLPSGLCSWAISCATEQVGHDLPARRWHNERVLDYSGHGLDVTDMLALAACITESQVGFARLKPTQLKAADIH